MAKKKAAGSSTPVEIHNDVTPLIKKYVSLMTAVEAEFPAGRSNTMIAKSSREQIKYTKTGAATRKALLVELKSAQRKVLALATSQSKLYKV